MSENQTTQNDNNEIVISTYTKALIDTLRNIKKRQFAPEISRISVSQTVSFVAILYEKIRNAVEFRDDHLIRRASIERILKRRLMINPQAKGEGENLIRELLWARYLPNNSITDLEVEKVQEIINRYLTLKQSVLNGRPNEIKTETAKFITELMTCEVEEELNKESTEKKAAFLYYFYQVLKNKVEIKEISEEEKDAYFYVASEISFSRSDLAYIRYHLFKLLHGKLSEMSPELLHKVTTNFLEISHHIDKTINNPFSDKLIRFVRKQVPPFLILSEIINRYPSEIEKIITNKLTLWEKVDFICREKYQQTSQKLQRGAIRSVVYIFLTKMVFVIGLEWPVSKFFYGTVHMGPLIANTIFPPILMGILVSFVNVPSENNTKKIFNRIIDILNKDPQFENTKSLVTNKHKVKSKTQVIGFSLFYLLTFWVTFSLMYSILDYFSFNIISKTIFIFFVSMITFFAYRIKQTANEFVLEEKQSILEPVFDFFIIPVFSLGKILSTGIAKINFFVVIFDFFIEAPFKLIFNIVEEWINFVKARKEEIM